MKVQIYVTCPLSSFACYCSHATEKNVIRATTITLLAFLNSTVNSYRSTSGWGGFMCLQQRIYTRTFYNGKSVAACFSRTILLHPGRHYPFSQPEPWSSSLLRSTTACLLQPKVEKSEAYVAILCLNNEKDEVFERVIAARRKVMVNRSGENRAVDIEIVLLLRLTARTPLLYQSVESPWKHSTN